MALPPAADSNARNLACNSRPLPHLGINSHQTNLLTGADPSNPIEPLMHRAIRPSMDIRKGQSKGSRPSKRALGILNPTTPSKVRLSDIGRIPATFHDLP
jgi:hypothetical protein